MSFGRSFIFFASTATVTTGSLTCFISSKGVTSSRLETVDPTIASLSPVSATIFPAGISSTSILSGPIYTPTCWTLFLLFIPDMLNSIPLFKVPLKSLPVATSPACGSGKILVTISATGPILSHSIMDLATSLSISPCHIAGSLIF